MSAYPQVEDKILSKLTPQYKPTIKSTFAFELDKMVEAFLENKPIELPQTGQIFFLEKIITLANIVSMHDLELMYIFPEISDISDKTDKYNLEIIKILKENKFLLTVQDVCRKRGYIPLILPRGMSIVELSKNGSEP